MRGWHPCFPSGFPVLAPNPAHLHTKAPLSPESHASDFFGALKPPLARARKPEERSFAHDDAGWLGSCFGAQKKSRVFRVYCVLLNVLAFSDRVFIVFFRVWNRVFRTHAPLASGFFGRW